MDQHITTGITEIKYLGYAIGVLIFQSLDIPSVQFGILGILMCIDFFAGLSKWVFIDSSKITSYNAWKGIMKKGWTLITIIAIALMIKGIGVGDFEGYLKFFISLLIMAETYSIIQNVYSMRTGKDVSEYDAVSFILKSIGNNIFSLIEKTLGEKQEKDPFKDPNIYK